MLELAKWYEDGSPAGSSSKTFNETGPYMRIQDAVPASEIMRELCAIGERLHAVDPILSDHLRNFDIPPQLYGIRWLRLLFGREFAIHDLLYVWDVILCDRPISRMVECIYIAMLVQIRHLLLQSDYGGCLQYLMRYPPIMDVSAFIQEALHYRNPKKYASQQLGVNSLGNFSHLTITVSNLRNITSSVFSKVKNSVLEKPLSPTVSTLASPRSVMESASGPPTWEREILLMEEQIACLQTKVNEKDIICAQAAQEIEVPCVAHKVNGSISHSWLTKSSIPLSSNGVLEQLRKGTEHTVSELCEKLMEIKRRITTVYPNDSSFNYIGLELRGVNNLKEKETEIDMLLAKDD
ncbi:hypothetical protein KIN20_027247 [Parelaphostrongylus tenuis]|uniref:Rab-GAP TBC domain-containing protein n=1 Tax=Parelaphostrongylus tenuis TaxID=148309 RepID=A0AAD5WDK7_PARTN|nr:hypothetical protein KIN20_027247 [Parelaphostrongylus tenuis]